MALSLYQKAPDFSLPATGNKIITLSKDFANKSVILYFYPKDFTRGCTAEACSFRDSLLALQGIEIPVLGISRDSIETHEKFKKAYQLPFDLLSDLKGNVIKQYDAFLFPILGIVKRISYVLDKDHKIVGVYESMFDAKAHVKHTIEIYQHKL
ncbi:MAG: peroxiredoxin [Cytophagales bacterium]|nr:peroxiredoxin [Cytophagales bacterium]MDW8383460.1 peroxiredoxin [Flammeovirgaceae bacterium]